LEKALVRFGQQGLLLRIVAPLAEQVGQMWRQGELTAAHEHFFTATARTFMGTLAQQFAVSDDAPVLVAATPAGQYHELGAFMAAVAATYLGWRGVYLGCSLPAAEIAAAVIQLEAPVLVLSIIYPADDRKLPNELQTIRKRLPDTTLIVGGRVAHSYNAVLKRIKARIVDDIAGLGDELDKIRASRGK
jgi:MerR family transcriptional regulator, light-induced transcriptional regulator